MKTPGAKIGRAARGALCLLLLIASSGRAAAVEIDGLAAKVNGEIITLLELEKAAQPVVERELRDVPAREKAAKRRQILRAVLDQLIVSSLQLQKAAELGIGASRQEVDTAVERVKQSGSLSDEAFALALEKENITESDYRRRLREQITVSKLLQREVRSRITVAEEEIAGYYADHGEEYRHAARIRVRHLLVPLEVGAGADQVQEARRDAQTLLERARGGEDFASLIENHSPATASGGDHATGWLKRGEFLRELEEVAFNLPAGRVSEPTRTQAGFHLLQVVEREEERTRTIEEVRDPIVQTLTDEKMEEGMNKWLADLRKGAQIEILL